MQQRLHSEGGQSAPPELSVIITVVSGATQLRDCLTALSEQQGFDTGKCEIIVPYDKNDNDITLLEAVFPGVLFHPLQPSVNCPGGKCHELADQFRATGLLLAKGNILGMLVDHDKPDKHWCRNIIETHAQPYAAVGGVMENGIDRPINWATYFFDFGRYQTPVERGPSQFLTDVNIAYKRDDLNEIKHVWQHGFDEPKVHGALLKAGKTLWLCPDIIVYQNRTGLTIKEVLRERVLWGRYFAGTRIEGAGMPKRIAYCLISLAVPAIILAKMSRNAFNKKRLFGVFVKVLPINLLLILSWSYGEFSGYFTGRKSNLG